MRIITEKGEFELPEGFLAETIKTNPLLSDVGEQTAPITLPATPLNLKLLHYPHRIDAYYKPIESLEVSLIDGFTAKKGRLRLNEVNETGISCTIYFNISQFYSLIDGVKLHAIDFGALLPPDDAKTKDEKITYLIERMRRQFRHDNDSDFRVAPVATTTKYKWKTDAGTGDEKLFILNAPANPMNLYYIDNSNFTDIFFGERPRIQLTGNAQVTLPRGYGITPFLTLHFALRKIFSAYGYTFKENKDWKDIVVLNSVADALSEGKIMYWQLLPDVGVKEFLAEVSRWFNGAFYVDENTRSASFLSFRNIGEIDKDLTPYLLHNPMLGVPEFTRIIIDDANDEKKAELPERVKSEVISFAFPKELTVEDTYECKLSPETPSFVEKIKLVMMQTGDVIHRNTSIVINGVAKKKETDTSSDILFVKLPDTHLSVPVSSSPDNSGTYTYRHTLPFHGVRFANSEEFMRRNIYRRYCEFRLNANVPVSAKLSIPKRELENLNLASPKRLLGQKVLIESVKYTIGGDEKNTQAEIIFRVLENFRNR